MVQCRVSFFKDLVSSDGHPSSVLQQSIEISGAENVTSAVEEAKRHYEQLRRVPIWSLCADRLKLEIDGCPSELTKSLKKLTRHWTMAAISPVVLWLQFPSLRGFFGAKTFSLKSKLTSFGSG